MEKFVNNKEEIYLFVDTNEGDYYFKLNHFGDRILYQNDESEAPFPLGTWLPQGNYELIGLAKDVSEGVAREILGKIYTEEVYSKSSIQLYRYELDKVVQSLGLNNPIILKKI